MKSNSNLFTLAFCATIALAFFGCSASEEPSEGDAQDIGAVEQAINVGNGGYGLGSTAAHLHCDEPGTAGQTCYIPGQVSVTVGFCYSSGFTPSEKGNISTGLSTIHNQTNWNFVETGFPCPLVLVPGSVGSGSNFTLIESFVNANLTGTITSLTSPPGISHVNGTWRSYTSMVGIVDTAHILAAPNGQQAMIQNQVGRKLGTWFIGLGTTVDSAHQGSPTRRAVDPNSPITGLTPGDVCRANNVNSVSPTTVSVTAGCGI